MRGINYRSLTQNWRPIIDKLCDEVTPHDVLDVVLEHLETTQDICVKMSMKSDNIDKAMSHLKIGISEIKKAMKQIDPEG